MRRPRRPYPRKCPLRSSSKKAAGRGGRITGIRRQLRRPLCGFFLSFPLILNIRCPLILNFVEG